MSKFFRLAHFVRRLAATIIRNTWAAVSQREASRLLGFFAQAADNPASAGTPRQRLEIAGIGASGTLDRLVELGALEQIQPMSAADLRTHLDSSKWGAGLELKLRNLFDIHGSDKGSAHGYSLLYAWLLDGSGLEGKFRVLEIGLGTNRTSILSNMGPGGRPGASLRAWRDMGESIEVVGLDVDKEILIEEERISTYYVDQLNPKTWEDLPADVMKSGFDLIVDDGLHAPLANLNTIIATLPFLRKNGFLVVEDVPERALPVWTLAKSLIDESLDLSIYKLNYAHCVVIRRED